MRPSWIKSFEEESKIPCSKKPKDDRQKQVFEHLLTIGCIKISGKRYVIDDLEMFQRLIYSLLGDFEMPLTKNDASLLLGNSKSSKVKNQQYVDYLYKNELKITNDEVFNHLPGLRVVLVENKEVFRNLQEKKIRSLLGIDEALIIFMSGRARMSKERLFLKTIRNSSVDMFFDFDLAGLKMCLTMKKILPGVKVMETVGLEDLFSEIVDSKMLHKKAHSLACNAILTDEDRIVIESDEEMKRIYGLITNHGIGVEQEAYISFRQRVNKI